ncbi:MAG: hypothetical protein JRN52_08025 [Nitrososphaerota archaeon]|nr:hypothetical protein [Nitrososphaerota archaeon]
MEKSIKFYAKGLGMELVAKLNRFPPTGRSYAYVKARALLRSNSTGIQCPTSRVTGRRTNLIILASR